MFKRRGSFKVAPGVRLNYGKRGFTSVNVAGVRLGSSRSAGPRRPTKTEILAKNWRLKPGTHFVRIEIGKETRIDLVVDGAELTYPRMDRLKDGLYDGNTEAVARTFKTFVKSWDILADDGKPLPINWAAVDRLGVEMIFGMAVEAANALKIPAKPLGSVLKDRATGKPARVTVSSRPMPSTTLPLAPGIMAQAAPAQASSAVASGRKSTFAAYVLWLATGLLGGHRYYLGRTGSAFLMTITLGGVGIWWLLDAFKLPSLVRTANAG